MSETKENKWEHWYLKLYRQAAAGRLLGGFVHNINGSLQAFSMQTELLKWMFTKCYPLLDNIQALAGEGPLQEQVLALRKLIDSRSKMMEQVQSEIGICQKNMQHVMFLEHPEMEIGEHTTNLSSVVGDELSFMNADMFFKHKVKKEVRLAGSMPPLQENIIDIHEVVHILLENAVEAMQGSKERQLVIETSLVENTMCFTVQDSGGGIVPEYMERIFEPFFSTKDNHAGLGLYLAKRLVKELGGTITAENLFAGARFSLCLPTRV